MRLRKKGSTFYCFSPPIMIATFVIELSFALYIVWRYKLDTLGRLILVTLLCLSAFQLAEYNVCESSDTVTSFFSRFGYVAITLLPPLVIHMISVISGRVQRYVVGLAYSSAAAFAAIFGLVANSFDSHICAGNYAIFQLAPRLGGVYFSFYYFWLILAIIMCLYYSLTSPAKIRRALTYQAFGLLVFLIPTGVVNAVNPNTIPAIPSVMCGFAVMYAVILTFGLAPLMLKTKR